MDATETTAASVNGQLIEEEYDQVDNFKVVKETDRHLSGSPTPSEQSYVDFDPADNEYVVNDLDSCSIEQNCAYISNTGINDQPPDYLEVITQQNSDYSIEASNVYCVADPAVAGHENGELYEVLPEMGERTQIVPQRREQNNVVQKRAKNTMKKVPPRGLCSFWQGRVEVAIRIIILMVSPCIL